jgi:SAM-dependent methyltransferase
MIKLKRELKRAASTVLGSVPIVGRILGRFASPHSRPSIPHGPGGINVVGHRRYVGGLWDEIGRLQFEFLVENGLKPQHYLLDIACGSLRAGVHFIPYLETGHYLGIDKEPELIDRGIKQELSSELVKRKQPQFVVSDSFEFEKFSSSPDFALAQSLFTHLPPQIVNLCFRKLRDVVHPNSVFYATFFETAHPKLNLKDPHDHARFVYTRQEMENFGTQNGWSIRYIGDWNHPRNQVIVEYRPSNDH